MTEASQAAIAILRDPSQFKWYVIPIFVIVVYIYANEIEKRNWSLVLAGLAFWGMDWFNEIWNALVFYGTGRSAVWTAPGKTAYLILIGLNIEITMMFAILGIVLIKMLPADKKAGCWEFQPLVLRGDEFNPVRVHRGNPEPRGRFGLDYSW